MCWAYKRAALGGGRLQEFRHLVKAENLGAPPVWCTPCGLPWNYSQLKVQMGREHAPVTWNNMLLTLNADRADVM